jgi:hypothetical protein
MLLCWRRRKRRRRRRSQQSVKVSAGIRAGQCSALVTEGLKG